MTEWLLKEKEKEIEKSTGEEAGGGLHFSEFLGGAFFQAAFGMGIKLHGGSCGG